MYSYKTHGTCARQIDFKVVDGKIHDVSFVGGCNGNLGGISKLVEGQDAENIISMLEGTTCGKRSTSCPDQLSQALKQALDLQAQHA